MLMRLVSRLALALVVALGVASLVFALIHLTPGDPVEAMLGESATSVDRAALRTALGLDAPLSAQWWRFVRALADGDLGRSLASQRAVATLIAERLPQTLVLALAAMGVALALALPLGLYSALRAGTRWDLFTSTLAVLGMALPSFVLGPLLMMVFAVQLGWLPVAGGDTPAALVLPALTLGLALAALLTRMVRAAVCEVLSEPYILAARARGLGAARVLWRHALRNAALPVLTVVGLQLGALLGGAVITEMVFGWPGLGQLTIEAIQHRDYPLVQGCVLTVSLGYVGLNLLTDLLYGCLDPRVRGL
ncbi:MAG: ABC transporter permease [Gammaproteobacteria bacterium]|nr:ABC transporter permease [Gammaproteobacteria bacterium]